MTLDANTRQKLINHAAQKGFSESEIEKLIMEFIEIANVHGLVKAYERFIIKLIG